MIVRLSQKLNAKIKAGKLPALPLDLAAPHSPTETSVLFGEFAAFFDRTQCS